MNTKLLRRIQKQILREPKQFDMSWWFTRRKGVPNCGTAACIAGWASALTLRQSPEKASDIGTAAYEQAESVLELNYFQCDRLFYEENWPALFRGGSTPKIRARRAVARIDHFIKTKGNE